MRTLRTPKYKSQCGEGRRSFLGVRLKYQDDIFEVSTSASRERRGWPKPFSPEPQLNSTLSFSFRPGLYMKPKIC